MPLEIGARAEGEFAVLELKGPLTLSPPLRTVRESARELLRKSKYAGVIVDVASVTAVDSSGLGELTVIYTFASRHGCGMALAGSSPTLRGMLEVTRLDGILPSAQDVETAKKMIKER
ncbi:MAG: STAS domain-containing protein [Bryobacteraceae bacterium]